jgi:hypothetical protein
MQSFARDMDYEQVRYFLLTCKYNYNLPIDYGKTAYVWTLEMMNLFIIKGNVNIYVFFVIE